MYLSADHALFQPLEVGVRPGALAPGGHAPQVVREVDSVELVVDELPDVPGEVVVSEIRPRASIINSDEFDVELCQF